MADMRGLVVGLDEYRNSMKRHLEALQTEFDSLTLVWQALNECFEGHAADEFRPIWENTSRQFREYTDQGREIERILAERIESLREVDRSNSLEI